MTDNDLVPTNIARGIVKKNGGFDVLAYTPQTPTQRIAIEILKLVYEDGDRMGEQMASHPHCLAENGTQAFKVVLAWAHHELQSLATDGG